MENNKNHSDRVDFSLEIGPEKPPTNESSTNQNSESSTNANTPQSRDEITKFQNARYISASESIWRIFNFKNHDQHDESLFVARQLANLDLQFEIDRVNANRYIEKYSSNKNEIELGESLINLFRENDK